MKPEEYAVKVAKLPDRVAAVLGKTYAVMGDAATLDSDTALMILLDYVEEIDETIIERNKQKRLTSARTSR